MLKKPQSFQWFEFRVSTESAGRCIIFMEHRYRMTLMVERVVYRSRILPLAVAAFSLSSTNIDYSILQKYTLYVSVSSEIMVAINKINAVSRKQLFHSSAYLMYEETVAFIVFQACGVEPVCADNAWRRLSRTCQQFPLTNLFEDIISLSSF